MLTKEQNDALMGRGLAGPAPVGNGPFSRTTNAPTIRLPSGGGIQSSMANAGVAAGAHAAAQANAAKQRSQVEMSRMGINTRSPRYAGLLKEENMQAAAMAANAATSAANASHDQMVRYGSQGGVTTAEYDPNIPVPREHRIAAMKGAGIDPTKATLQQPVVQNALPIQNDKGALAAAPVVTKKDADQEYIDQLENTLWVWRNQSNYALGDNSEKKNAEVARLTNEVQNRKKAVLERDLNALKTAPYQPGNEFKIRQLEDRLGLTKSEKIVDGITSGPPPIFSWDKKQAPEAHGEVYFGGE